MIPAFAAVAVAFLAAELPIQYAMARIHSASDEIAFNEAPSAEHLGAVAGGVRRVQLLMERELRRARHPSSARLDVENALAEAEAHFQAYLALPVYPDEWELWRGLRDEMRGFSEAVGRALAEADHGGIDAAGLAGVDAAAERLLEAGRRHIAFEEQNGRAEALKIQRVRRDATRLGVVLDALCVAFALCVGLLLYRQERQHGVLVAEYASFLERRGDEFEAFAERVAHDIRNDVLATKVALEVAVQRQLHGPAGRELVEGGIRSLGRTEAIIDGLLQFARAGAQPEAMAGTDMRPVVEDVVSGVRPAAEGAGIALAVEEVASCGVACGAGILTSLLSNLVQNAVEHMGPDGGMRRVTVRVRERKDAVRAEVEDTGPGIPGDVLDSIFLPRVRALAPRKQGERSGLGLGLATVRRLAEAHGGSVGVLSVVGKGSTFWFSLPKAPPDSCGPAAGLARPINRNAPEPGPAST